MEKEGERGKERCWWVKLFVARWYRKHLDSEVG